MGAHGLDRRLDWSDSFRTVSKLIQSEGRECERCLGRLKNLPRTLQGDSCVVLSSSVAGKGEQRTAFQSKCRARHPRGTASARQLFAVLLDL